MAIAITGIEAGAWYGGAGNQLIISYAASKQMSQWYTGDFIINGVPGVSNGQSLSSVLVPWKIYTPHFPLGGWPYTRGTTYTFQLTGILNYSGNPWDPGPTEYSNIFTFTLPTIATATNLAPTGTDVPISTPLSWSSDAQGTPGPDPSIVVDTWGLSLGVVPWAQPDYTASGITGTQHLAPLGLGLNYSFIVSAASVWGISLSEFATFTTEVVASLPDFPSDRPDAYDPDFIWVPGEWDGDDYTPPAWGSPGDSVYISTGGGRWQQQLVAIGNNLVYIEDIN